MKLITFVTDIDVKDETSGYILTHKTVATNGAASLGSFISSVVVPFGTTAAAALSSLKSAVVQEASGRGISALTTDVTVYGASIN